MTRAPAAWLWGLVASHEFEEWRIASTIERGKGGTAQLAGGRLLRCRCSARCARCQHKSTQQSPQPRLTQPCTSLAPVTQLRRCAQIALQLAVSTVVKKICGSKYGLHKGMCHAA